MEKRVKYRKVSNTALLGVWEGLVSQLGASIRTTEKGGQPSNRLLYPLHSSWQEEETTAGDTPGPYAQSSGERKRGKQKVLERQSVAPLEFSGIQSLNIHSLATLHVYTCVCICAWVLLWEYICIWVHIHVCMSVCGPKLNLWCRFSGAPTLICYGNKASGWCVGQAGWPWSPRDLLFVLPALDSKHPMMPPCFQKASGN